MYAFSVYKKKLAEPGDYLKPLFIAVSISFAIVHFAFGVHGEAFASYDDEISTAGIDRYKWFKTDEVLRFPISQLDFKNKPTPKVVDFGSLKNTRPTLNIIIVDKTGSITKKDDVPSIMKDSIREKINDKFGSSISIEDINKYSIQELLPPFLIGDLMDNMVKSSANDSVDIRYYTGHSFKNQPDGLIHIRNVPMTSVKKIKEDAPNYIQTYFAGTLEFDKRAKGIDSTSFNEIVNSLKKDILSHDEYKRKDINVSIISDFLDTSPTETIPDFSKIGNIKGLNLYVLNGSEPKSSGNSASQLIKKMVRRFSLQHRNNIINFKEVNFNDQNDVKKFYENDLWMSGLQVFDERYDNSVPFYSPFIDFRSNQAAVANIAFKDSALYSLRMTDLDSSNADFPIIYNTDYNMHSRNSDSVVFPGEVFKISAKPKDILRISLPHAFRYRNDRLFIEISSHQTSKTYVLPISFRPLLPETTSYYLFVFYTIFVVSISLMLMLPNLFVFCLIVHGAIVCPRRRRSMVLAFPVAIGAAFLVYYCDTLCLSHKNLLFTFILVLITTLLFTVPSFILDIKEAKTKPPQDFNPWAFLKFLVEIYRYLKKVVNSLLD